MYTDDELLPISALQHLQFCPRRAGLVHLERVWAENRFTTEGRDRSCTGRLCLPKNVSYRTSTRRPMAIAVKRVSPRNG